MKILLIALILFVVSFFLPAYYHEYGKESGYECALFCLFIIISGEFGSAGRAYYFSFSFSNIAMIVLVPLLATVFRRKRVPLFIKVIQVILIMHVLSWLVFHIGGLQIGDVKIGYYLWLGSMCMVLWCSLRRRNVEPVSAPDCQKPPNLLCFECFLRFIKPAISPTNKRFLGPLNCCDILAYLYLADI
jgi:hypothetical protein